MASNEYMRSDHERLAVLRLRHGGTVKGKKTPEYSAFIDARGRCNNPRRKQFEDYGGRGIKFLFTSFARFIIDVGLKPRRELTLDRINNNLHYQAGNVRWATRKQQVANRRLH